MAEAARKLDDTKDYVAESEIVVDAAPDAVWAALTDSAKMKEVMFGSTVTTDWKVGSPITYSGEWEGKKFEDKGKILELDKPRTFRSTHTAGSDPNHTEHEVTYRLAPEGKGTRVLISQTNNPSADAQAKSAKNWDMALKNLKKVVEGA